MRFIGIDLGTTNSVVAHYVKGQTMITPIDGGEITPSVVYFPREGAPLVGRSAAKRAALDPARALRAAKRYMGERKTWTIDGKTYSPVDAASMTLSYLKKGAEAALGGTIEHAVIAIPAYFTEAQRRDTRLAAEMAGIEPLQLLPEPTAAAIAYGVDRGVDQTLLVFDLGGGTFDVSILEVKGAAFNVRAVDGNHHLGGEDLNKAIAQDFIDRLKEQVGKTVSLDAAACDRLNEVAETVKIELSERRAVEVEIPQLLPGHDFRIEEYTRGEFETRIQPLLDEMRAKCASVIDAAGLDIDDISRVVLVGGSCKHVLIRDMVKRSFREPYQAPNMDTFVARGAAIACADLARPALNEAERDELNLPQDLIIVNRTAHRYGVDVRQGEGLFNIRLKMASIIDKQSAYPARGAVLGLTETKFTEEITLNVYRGDAEWVRDCALLGKLRMTIDRETLGVCRTLVASVFELNTNGELVFKAVQMPMKDPALPDLEQLIEESDPHSGQISYDRLQMVLDRHNFEVQKTTLKV